MSSLPINIIQVGARTPVGLTAASSAAAVRAGISRLGEHPYMIDKSGNPYLVAMDRTIETPIRNERLHVLVNSAIDEALRALPISSGFPLPIYLALPEAGAFFGRADIDELTVRTATQLAPRVHAEIRPLPLGNAAGLLGLAQALELIQRGPHELILVAGADSHLDADFLEHLDAACRLASRTNRWGYPPGEGAGALVLASARMARSLGLPALAELRSVGIAEEPNRIATDAVCIGEGLAAAFQQAIGCLRIPEEKVSAVYCDVNGERYRNSEYIYASQRLPPSYLDDPSSFFTAVDCYGDVGAASGLLQSILAIASARRGYAKGPCALVWASSESGLRGAAIYELPLQERPS